MPSEHLQGNANNHTGEAGDQHDHDDLIRQRLPLLYRGLKRSSSTSLLTRKTLTVLATAPPNTTPSKTQARHQSSVPAGTKSKPPKMTTFRRTPPINVKMDI